MSTLNDEELKQALEPEILETILLLFDGGCQPNPGTKYGSYLISRKDRGGRTREVVRKVRFPLGQGTNNEAEFEALESGLKFLLSDLEAGGFDLLRYRLEIQTDSMIVSNRLQIQLPKDAPPKDARSLAMHVRCARCQSLISKFPNFFVQWVPRSVNITVFGH